jgi:signal transduction histidine kinase
VSNDMCKSGSRLPLTRASQPDVMSGGSSLARKKRDRSTRSQPRRNSGTNLAIQALQQLAAAHEACRATFAERPSAVRLQALATALRQIFQAEVAILRIVDLPPLEAVSPRGSDTRGWGELLGAPASEPHGATSSVVVEPSDERMVAAGVERVVVVPIDAGPARGALWLGYGKKAPSDGDDLVMFDLLGDYLALALRHASAAMRTSDPSAPDARDDLISQAAHDLRTPLTPISMLLQTLERKAAAGTVDIDSIARARRQVQRLTDMVSDMVDIARLRDGRLLLEPAVLDLREAFDRGAKAFGERERRRSVQLALGDEPLFIVADSERTVHALASLFEHVARLAQGDAPLRANIERRNSDVVVHIDSERSTPIAAGFDAGPAAAGISQRPVPLGLGVRFADALFARLGGNLQIAGGRDGSARVEITFPLAPSPANAERSAG